MSSVVNNSISMDPTETNAAQVGDLIVYAYHFTRWGVRDFSVTTRAVQGVGKDADGKVIGYHVEGDYWVDLKHVQSVIPMDAESVSTASGSDRIESAGGCQTKDFPLEAGQ